MSLSKKAGDLLWDLWCCLSIIGIWPRFVEPNLLGKSVLHLQIPDLPADLEGFKIVHFTDLHFNSATPASFLRRISKAVQRVAPDLIVFTGDFLCNSVLEKPEELKKFLNSFSAPFGCFAVLGNHDYEKPVSVNSQGDYDLVDFGKGESLISRGFKRLFHKISLTKKITERVRALSFHAELLELLKETPFQLLENETKKIQVGGSFLNITGLGEYTLGRLNQERAFKEYDKHFPGIVLAHNPDSIAYLEECPGELILSGHTHGGQINLPWIVRKYTLLEDLSLRKGLLNKKGRWIYVNRGVGGLLRFRWFSPPEILSIILERPELE